MKYTFTIFLVLTLLCTMCQQSKQYERLSDGIVVHPTSAKGQVKSVRLQVISPNIIHVSASPGEAIPTKESLMLSLRETEKSDWSFEENEEQIVLKTEALQAHINLATGGVTFTDANGETILKEIEGGGKTFSAVTVDDSVKSYQIRQQFDSPDGEGFYGLGQHQNGEYNYKGLDVNLTQFNSVAVIPFVVSTRNYGILWDNNGITRFGDPRPYAPLSTLTLFDADGKEGGLTAQYAQESNPAQPEVTRVEKEIDYKFLKDQSKFPEGFSLDNALVTWEGAIQTDISGLHKFLVSSAGYTKIWVDGKKVVENWREAWNPNTNKFRLELEKGKKYPIKIEWRPDGGESYMGLEWLSPMPGNEQTQLSLSSEVGDLIDYYFVKGENMDEVIGGYRTLTGSATIVPKWAMGFWQSRERYTSEGQLMEVVKEYRKRKIPLDNIVLDWQYWGQSQWGSHEFAPDRFPTPKAMVDSLHDIYHTQIMISVWPKFGVDTDHFQEMNEKGLLYTKNVEDSTKDWLGDVSTFYDAFNPEGRKLYWQQIKEELYDKGFDAWWLDATEPDVLSNASIERRKALMNPTYLGSSSRYFNAFPLMNAMAVYEGQREVNPDKRVFILTRSAFAGLQRYGASVWSGDISARWDELGRQIPGGLNFSMSGLPYWTTDIGGFFVEDHIEQPNAAQKEEWRALMARWFQFGTFCPLLRVHGQPPFREMFNVAPDNHPVYKTMVQYDQLRYRMMPYLYTLAGMTYHDDYTIMRGLAMDFSNDARVLNIKDQYMFGPSLLVAPVYEYQATSRSMYLPANTGWYDLYTGEFQEGGQQYEADAPLEKIPVMAKAGAILPFGPELQYALEKPAESITLYIYTGADGAFELYEDENLNYNYEKGDFAKIPLTYSEKDQTLTIGKREGSFTGMLENRVFNIVKITPDQPKALNLNQQQFDHTVQYNGESQKLQL